MGFPQGHPSFPFGHVHRKNPWKRKRRNLFAKDIEEGAVSFIGWSGSGFVIGKPGMVTLNDKNLECYGWQDDKLVKVERCSKEQEKMGKEARAQRAISEYIVRSGLTE